MVQDFNFHRELLKKIQILDQSNTMCYTTKSIDPIGNLQQVDGTITAQIRIPADSIWFDGHFPGIAVLPGVAQLAIVTEIVSRFLGKPVRVTNVSRVRFKQAIMPAEPVDVQIKPKENDPLNFSFRLMKADELVCSGFLNVRPRNRKQMKL